MTSDNKDRIGPESVKQTFVTSSSKNTHQMRWRRKRKKTPNYKHLNRCLQMSWYLINTNINYSIGILRVFFSTSKCFYVLWDMQHSFLFSVCCCWMRFNKLRCTDKSQKRNNSQQLKPHAYYDFLFGRYCIKLKWRQFQSKIKKFAMRFIFGFCSSQTTRSKKNKNG